MVYIYLAMGANDWFSMRYFISGAITKYISTPKGRKEVTDRFMNAEIELLAGQIATEVFNPISLATEFGWEEDWKFYMKICMSELIYCDGIYMLSGWENSRGARIEYAIAQELGLKLIHE